jgi:hypothetical protein
MFDDKTLEENLIYIPAPEKPADLNKRLAEITGLSPIGEPYLRIVWGMDRKKFYGGVEQIEYVDPNGKYVGFPFFIAECWSPASVYSETEWNELRFADGVDVLGEFPRKGVWDYLSTIRNADYSYAPAEKILEIAREWKFNSERPQAKQRAVADYIRFNQEKERRKKSALQEMRDQIKAELEWEFAKPVTNGEFSFSDKVRNIGMTKKEARAVSVGNGMSQTSSGLIVPTTAIKEQ